MELILIFSCITEENNINRRKALKSMGMATATVASVSGAAQATDYSPSSPAVQKLLAEVGNPEVEARTEKPLGNHGSFITINTPIGELRYAEYGEKKLGVQFVFAELTSEVRNQLPDDYQELPSGVNPSLLINSEGRLEFIRSASKKEEKILAEITGVSAGDATMAYISTRDGFIVEDLPDKATADVSANQIDAYLVSVKDDPSDLLDQDTSTEKDSGLTNWLIGDSEDVGLGSNNLGRSEFQYALSEVTEFSGVKEFEKSELNLPSSEQSARIAAPDDKNCDDANWAHQCAKSLVACGACVPVCGSSVPSGGATLVLCFGCVGAACNFAVPLSCGYYLDCNPHLREAYGRGKEIGKKLAKGVVTGPKIPATVERTDKKD